MRFEVLLLGGSGFMKNVCSDVYPSKIDLRVAAKGSRFTGERIQSAILSTIAEKLFTASW